MQSTSSPDKAWITGVAEAPSPARDRQTAPLIGFVVALSLLVVYICSPWMG